MNKRLELNEDLVLAASHGDNKTVEELLNAGADINFFDELSKTALHYAVEGGHKRLVHFLLENGADVNAHLSDNIGDTPIIIAAYEGHYAVSKLLLKSGADPYITAWMGNDALDYAVRRKDPDGEKIKNLIVETHPPAKGRKYRYR